MRSSSTVYFPLRSNAHSLVAGAPVAAVRRRLKVASLVYDRVLIEEGVWDAVAGPGGSFSFWNPVTGAEEKWQSPQSRKVRMSSESHLVMGPPENPEAESRPSFGFKTETTVGWRATFEPFKKELPPGAGAWITFGHANDSAGGKRLASERRYRDRDNPALEKFLPSADKPFGFVRDRIIDDSNLDLFVGVDLTAAVSMDALHASVLRARLLTREAWPAFGSSALTILLPDVSDLPWEDLGEIRKDRGIGEFRALLAEIESAAWGESTSPESFMNLVHSEFEVHLTRAREKVEGTLKGRLVVAAVGFLLGEVASLAAGLPVVGGLAGGIGGAMLDTSLRRPPRWLATESTLRRRLGA